MRRYAAPLLAAAAIASTWGVTAGADGTYSGVECWGLLGLLAAALVKYIPRTVDNPSE